jgi:RHS repeat-associated protein
VQLGRLHRTAQNVTAGSGYTSLLTVNPVNNQITSPAFSYDARGNVTAEPSPLSATYAYDGEECNTSFTGNGNTATYTCDGNELRVKKVVTGTNAVTTVSIRSGGQVIAEYDNGAAVTAPTREYLYGNNLLAIVTGSSGGTGGTIVYQHRDHLSPRLYTDVNGTDIGEDGSYPFGEAWYNIATTSNWVYTSYERDAESGNDYALARSYANNQGRFLSPDPLEGVVGDPQSWNRYAYVENDPINLSDPSGQGFWSDLFNAIFDFFAMLGGASTSGSGFGDGNTATCANPVCIESTSMTPIFLPGPGGTGGPGSGGGVGGQGGTGQGQGNGGPTSNPGGGPGAGSTDSGNTGAGSAGPGGGGATSTASASTPGPGLPNGDVAVGGDIWHASAGCPNCGVIWGESQDFVYDFMKSEVIQAVGGVVFESIAAVRVASKVANEGIYEFTAASGKTYVGQSGNISARIEQHLASGKLLPQDVSTVRITEVVGGKTAREIAEQLRINQLGGIRVLENIRNPIGLARQYLLPVLLP